jgi:hypothetical protein
MRLLKSAVVAVFLLLLALPALELATGLVRVRPLDENRRRAELPGLAELVQPSSFVARLQAWFDDHYGFRDLLIRAKTQMDYSLFRSSERLHIGHDGFLFYRSVIDHEEPAVERMSEAQLDDTVQKFAQLRDYLAPKGIHLIVQTEQLKDKFYPEYLPLEAQFARTRHRFDEFRVKMAALPGVTYLDTTPELMRLKEKRPIFHKTDFHWNEPAAFVVAQRLVDTIAALDGRALPFWTNALQIEQRRFSGDQALFMPLFKPPSEMALFVRPTWDQNAYDRVDTALFPYTFTRRPPVPAGLLPRTVIFGDSFIDAMIGAGMEIYFEKLAYARIYQSELADVLRALPPGTKYFIFEFIEVALPNIAGMKLP